jgi:hypothetical protein
VSRELALAGCPFRVGPVAALDPREETRLTRLARASPVPARPGLRTFDLRIVDGPIGPEGFTEIPPDEEPARVTSTGRKLLVAHRRLRAEIDLAASEGRLYRTEPDGGALEIALRVALAARLPAEGALPLHAAGIVLEGAGVAFFGPSGAGKTTLAATAPGPIMSDELVVVRVVPPALIPTGFFGELREGEKPAAAAPLVAAVELARGPTFALERLDRSLAVRRLLGSILAPAAVDPWREALAIAGRLVAAVPVYRMEWSPAMPPWTALRAALPRA